MEPWLIEQEIDLAQEAPSMRLKEGTLMYAGNALAHLWRVKASYGGAPLDLSGMGIVGEFIRQDPRAQHMKKNIGNLCLRWLMMATKGIWSKRKRWRTGFPLRTNG